MPAQDFQDEAGMMATLGAQYPSAGGGNMSASSGVSRLGMMQARLREQLMLDKESRLLQMAARREEEQEGTIKRVTKSSASTLSSSLSSLSSLNSSFGGQGRVRKLFQERRTNGFGTSPVGRDKSYPLDPVRNGGGGNVGAGGRPPVKPVKGVVRTRGVSVDRGKANYDPEAMRRSRSHAAFQNSVNNNNINSNAFSNSNSSYAGGEPRSPARALRPPAGRSLQHHKSTSSLLDANQNYNGRLSSSSSGVYSRGPSRDPSPAPSPSPSNLNRFGFRGPPSRGASPAPPPALTSPVRTTPPPTTTRASTRPQPPPRQRPSPPPRQPPRQTRPVRQPSPPDEDDADSAFSNENDTSSKSKARFEGPPITQVRSFRASPSTAPAKPLKATKPAPAPKPTKSSTPAAPRPKPVPGLASCKICGRNFAPDRIEKHETICSKSKNKAKKRKVFDPVKMRTKGTEAEKFVAKGKHLQDKPVPKKKDWKKQHEDFIATIRAAKAGTEAPPVDNSDYVECPHCLRKFSEVVADRHIPKCANITSNKAPAMRRRR
ncbi:serine/arginine repetitive matrix protein 1-like isoform X4 [Eriocheir sinensis]|uniref:serine/arginine repetitive matrix protein 1-like isoform X4 n=1 Tax=Eriocheir sinensis TaxID=95602 RepID=UPI0021C839B0|nr:serine/arginine repetitive matrix protein 1-like isoform X4 [Eriocheir sinensis]